MRQKMWSKLVKDYNCDIRCYPRKANMIAYALSRKVGISHITVCRELQQDLVRKQIELITRLIVGLRIQLTLIDKIYIAQLVDEWCIQMRQMVVEGIQFKFVLVDDVVRFHNRVYVLSDDELRHKTLTEVHSPLYVIHLKSVKIS